MQLIGRPTRILLALLSSQLKGRFCSDSSAAGAANEGVLANFFNSLLSKKTGTSGSPGTGAVGAGVQGSAKKTGITSNTRVHCFFCCTFFPTGQLFFSSMLANAHTVKTREGRNDCFLRLCTVFALSFVFAQLETKR